MTSKVSEKTGVILVIDDEEVVTDLLKTVLAQEGYEVHLAHGGRQGLQMALDMRPDLILMDIYMPDLNGYQATEQLKQNPRTKEVPVIFLSGRSASEDGGRSFEKGGTTFIRKPFSNEQIINIVALAMPTTKT